MSMSTPGHLPPSTPLSQPESSPLTLPSPLSEMEAQFYYKGLPSSPILVARTSTTPWEMSTNPDSGKELRSCGSHPITKVNNLQSEVTTLLGSMMVEWTSIDILRIGMSDEHFAPVILWIGVTPKSLSGNDGAVAASKCKELLVKHNITDVDVEIRESVVWPNWGYSKTVQAPVDPR